MLMFRSRVIHGTGGQEAMFIPMIEYLLQENADPFQEDFHRR